MSVREASTLVYSSDEPEDSYGRCECGRGFMVLDAEARAVDATCTACGRSERVHCCDDCAYGYAPDDFPPLDEYDYAPVAE